MEIDEWIERWLLELMKVIDVFDWDFVGILRYFCLKIDKYQKFSKEVNTWVTEHPASIQSKSFHKIIKNKANTLLNDLIPSKKYTKISTSLHQTNCIETPKTIPPIHKNTR